LVWLDAQADIKGYLVHEHLAAAGTVNPDKETSFSILPMPTA